MTTGRDGVDDPAAGGPARHIPVLLAEVLAALEPAGGETVVDATFGAGGYTRALLEAGARVVAVDRDPAAIRTAEALAAERPGRVEPVAARFGDLAAALAERAGTLDGIVLDIGVSSMQLDRPERGFSFRQDGPLDMRMGGEGATAADIVNQLPVKELTRLIGYYGEERQAGRIARAIAEQRDTAPFTRTLELAETVGRVVGRKPGDRIDPATRTFQALRIHVNDELGELARALVAAETLLAPGGRLAVVTFHSLEDRIVKRFLRDRSAPPGGSRHRPPGAAASATFAARNRATAAGEAEAAANPRARSAKLRSGVRTEAAPRAEAEPLAFAGLPTFLDIAAPGA